MKWQKPDGRIMDCQDNEATEIECLRLGFKKVGSPPVEIGEPEEGAHDSFNPADPDPAEDTDTDEQPELEAETCEITEDEMPSQSHTEDALKEKQSISQDEVGEMPKDILGG